MQREEGPSHPAFPASRSLRLFMGLLHKLGFFLPFSFLFSSLPFLPCFCKLNYLNALFGSLKSQHFPLFPPWLPFLSLLSAPAFSGSFPVLFQWHLLKFAQKRSFFNATISALAGDLWGQEDTRGGEVLPGERKEGGEGNAVEKQRMPGAGEQGGSTEVREQGGSPALPQVTHVVTWTQHMWAWRGLVSGLCRCVEGARTPLGGLRHQ